MLRVNRKIGWPGKRHDLLLVDRERFDGELYIIEAYCYCSTVNVLEF